MASPVPVGGLAAGVAHAPLARGRDDDDEDSTESEGETVEDYDDACAVDTSKAGKKPKAKCKQGKGKVGNSKESKNKKP